MSLNEKLKRVSKSTNDTPTMENCPGILFQNVEYESEKLGVTAQYAKKSTPSKSAKLSKNCSLERYRDIEIMHEYEDEEHEHPWVLEGIEFGDVQICADIAALLNDGDTENGLTTHVDSFVGTPANHEFVKGGRE